MEIENELHYTNKYRFGDLKNALNDNDNDKNKILEMFRERVEELYLSPAEELIEKAKENKNDVGYTFSAGLICVSVIDFLGRFYLGQCQRRRDTKCRFISWLLKYTGSSFDFDLADKFYTDFRNGLVHECRIKNGGEFSLNINNLKEERNGGRHLAINPEILLEEITNGFKKYLEDLEEDQVLFKRLKGCLMSDFEEDFRKIEMI